MTLEEFINNHYEYGEVYSEDPSIVFTQVECGDDIVEHKTVYNVNVYHLVGTDHYFEVTETRDNSGYWSDGERYDPEFRKVRPVKKVVEITEWRDV